MGASEGFPVAPYEVRQELSKELIGRNHILRSFTVSAEKLSLKSSKVIGSGSAAHKLALAHVPIFTFMMLRNSGQFACI